MIKVSWPKGNKYGNKKTEFGGRVYDSRLEARLAAEIELLIKGRAVKRVEPQKSFELRGMRGIVCRHVVDFLVHFPDGHVEAWDAKGKGTAEWKIKKKLFEDNYPEIKYVVRTKDDI